jgi:hypothetical protein
MAPIPASSCDAAQWPHLAAAEREQPDGGVRPHRNRLPGLRLLRQGCRERGDPGQQRGAGGDVEQAQSDQTQREDRGRQGRSRPARQHRGDAGQHESDRGERMDGRKVRHQPPQPADAGGIAQQHADAQRNGEQAAGAAGVGMAAPPPLGRLLVGGPR